MADTADLSHSIIADLYMEDFVFQLDYVEYGLNRNADQRGFPIDAPKRTMLKFKIRFFPDQEDDLPFLYDWGLVSDKKMDGFIVFGKREEGTEVRRVNFTGATCVGFRECFQSEQTNLLRELPLLFIPNTADYLPEYRGQRFFSTLMTDTAYDLVISADKIFIEGTEIPS